MKFLTPEECSDWLFNRQIAEDPYGRVPLTFQHKPPEERFLLDWMRAFIGNHDKSEPDTSWKGLLGESQGALLVFKDWKCYPPDMLALMSSIRRGHGERRPMIEAPGHLFDEHEDTELISHCWLSMIHGWTSYLYLASGNVTVNFWEGALIDFWSKDTKLIESIKLSLTKSER